jgi:hypothetical protein
MAIFYSEYIGLPFTWVCQVYKSVILDSITGQTNSNFSGDNINSPRAWFEVEGTLSVADGVAWIK